MAETTSRRRGRGRTVFVNTMVDPDTRRWVREEAGRRGTTVSTMLYELLLAERKRLGH